MLTRLNKVGLVLTLALLVVGRATLSSSKRLSLKESLTAYAENEESESQKYYSGIIGTPLVSSATNYSKTDGGKQDTHNEASGGTRSKNLHEEAKHSPSTSNSPVPVIRQGTNELISTSSVKTPVQKQFSLWEITKNMLLSFQQKGSKRFTTYPGTTAISKNDSWLLTVNNTAVSGVSGNSKSEDSLSLPVSTKEMGKQKAWDNFSPTVKNELGKKLAGLENNKNIAFNSTLSRIEAYWKDLEKQQQRTKKEVSSNAGLRDLLWKTAAALWSVQKEHFLPTFLHTKTGGKLSLIRDSIFKPITILSQFKSGVQEINNEKWENLARLTSAGTGWSSPVSEIFVAKLQPRNSHLLTLAKYILRLTKHTVITKWRLKRALLDLQFRALRKLVRIIRNKTISQKIATVKILANAAWKGKRAFLRTVTGFITKNTPSSNKPASYFGKDNSLNVDLTYSSLASNYKDHGKWVPDSYQPYPLPPSPPQDTYLPVPPLPNSKPVVHTNYYHNPENTPPLPLLPPSPSVSFLHNTYEPLIETPSYANALKIMGINPSSYDYKYEDASTVLEAPKPTIVHYSPSNYESHNFKSPVIEKPAASYSYHYSRPSESNDNDLSASSSFLSYLRGRNPLQGGRIVSSSPSQFLEYVQTTESAIVSTPSDEDEATTTTTSRPFRLKLLELMSANESSSSL